MVLVDDGNNERLGTIHVQRQAATNRPNRTQAYLPSDDFPAIVT
jgi:hypothetical protein